MAYELPLVRVYQQLEEVSPTLASPDLPALVIGRAYQVLTYADDKLDIFVGEYDNLSGNFFTPPSILAGGLLESSSIKVYMDEMQLEITNGTFNAALNDNKVVDAGATFTTDNIDIGDSVVIDHISLTEPLVRTVIGIAATTLTLNKNFTAALTGATYSVRKTVEDALLPASTYTVDENEVTLLPAQNYTLETVAYPIMEGLIYMEYNALRTDLLSAVDDVSSIDEIESKVGKIVPANPLALGLSLALANTTTSVKFLGVNTKVGNDLGWADARDILENNTDVYALALLTDDSEIIGLYKSHVELMSTADNHGWRICLGGTPLQTVKIVIEEQNAGEIYQSLGVNYLRDNAQEFSLEVNPGDRIEITSPGSVTGSYTIDQIVNDNVLAVTAANPFPTTASSVVYTIERDLSKSQQADEVASVIDSYNSKRVVIVWPDEFEVGSDAVPGYFAGCVVAGMIAGLPPHQGFTNMGVAGMGRLYHSNTYFNKEQLNKIAAAGGMIFVQDNPSALPSIRHQLTTDMQFVETRELSVVKNFDHLSYYFFNVLSPFIGVYNVTDLNVALIENTIELAAEAKTKAELPRIGAPLRSYTIRSVEESSVSSDRVEGKVKLDLPKPLNNIDLFLAI